MYLVDTNISLERLIKSDLGKTARLSLLVRTVTWVCAQAYSGGSCIRGHDVQCRFPAAERLLLRHVANERQQTRQPQLEVRRQDLGFWTVSDRSWRYGSGFQGDTFSRDIPVEAEPV
jgi:hypothetical protein